MQNLQDRIITVMRYTFYALFFITPFAMTNVNHELFEFNKMWLVYGFSVVIFFLWAFKMIAEKRFYVRRTILDIPILLFLGSQIISTIISMDPHTSFWGYYSRFNGGLLSTISYIFLYYALVSNFFFDKDSAKQFIKRILGVSILSGFLVALWGIPSHFGYDPTCMVFGRGLTTDCWTAAFRPTVRIFSTLGQPNWLAAYLSILLPISIAFFIKLSLPVKSIEEKVRNPKLMFFVLAPVIFYIAIIWTNSQSGFLGLWVGIVAFIGLVKLVAFKKNGFNPKKLFKLKSLKYLGLFVAIFLVLTFFIGNPFPKLQKYSAGKIIENTQTQFVEKNKAPAPEPSKSQSEAEPQGPSLETNITGSGEIRLIVWKGALDIFMANPITGTGVETFAFAYYKHRPAEHNLTSEWDYLYNKAHNEYLNYLATSGILGLGTYLSIIGLFFFYAVKHFLNEKSINSALIPASIVGGFISILVSNFFGFSVVMTNLYLFLLPAMFLMLTGKRSKLVGSSKKQNESYQINELNTSQFMVLSIIGIISLFFIWQLLTFWFADKAYALGYNYNKIQEYVLANEPLENSVDLRPGEDLYKNELSLNLSSIALAFVEDNQNQNAASYAQRAKEMSDGVIERNPNNVVYYKTRTKTLFNLAQIQPDILSEAYQTIQEAHALAPTDAKIMYNKALIEEVTEQPEKALETLDKTIELKPNYIDAYYRQAIVLSDLAESIDDPIKAEEYRQKAIDRLDTILSDLAPDFTQAQELLNTLE